MSDHERGPEDDEEEDSENLQRRWRGVVLPL